MITRPALKVTANHDLARLDWTPYMEKAIARCRCGWTSASLPGREAKKAHQEHQRKVNR
jgi:hypothetical protein